MHYACEVGEITCYIHIRVGWLRIVEYVYFNLALCHQEDCPKLDEYSRLW